MSTVSVRMNKEEQSVFTEYAKLTGVPLSTLLKKALEEKIEHDFDLKSILEYEKSIADNTLKTYTHSEVNKILEL